MTIRDVWPVVRRQPLVATAVALMTVSSLLSAVAGRIAYTATQDVKAVQRETCERGNEFRRQDLPRAFEAYSYFLGDELGAEPDQSREAYERFRPTLDELFPDRDC